MKGHRTKSKLASWGIDAVRKWESRTKWLRKSTWREFEVEIGPRWACRFVEADAGTKGYIGAVHSCE